MFVLFVGFNSAAIHARRIPLPVGRPPSTESEMLPFQMPDNIRDKGLRHAVTVRLQVILPEAADSVVVT